MGLFRRLSSGLFNPNEIKNYAKDKAIYTLLVFFLLLLFSIIPHTIQVSKLDSLNYKTKRNITEFFSINEEINFSIIDHKLVSNDGEKLSLYYEYTPEILIIFSNEEEDLNLGRKTALVFGENNVYLRQNVLRKDLFNYKDYDELEGLDLTQAKSSLNQEFWDTMFIVINSEFLKVKPIVVMTYILVMFITNAIYMLLFSLLITLFQMGRLRGTYRFPEVWKLSIYCLTPYVFGTLLSVLFNFEILSYVGLFMSVIYGVIMSRSITRE